MQIEKVDFSKLDFHEGKPDDQLDASKIKRVDEDESEEDESDSDGSDPTKTAEGGLIQALVNMQLGPLARNWLPEFKQKFTNNIQLKNQFECYGIHLGIPQLRNFNGGFILSGKYDQVVVNEDQCIEISTNGLDFLGRVFAPEIIRTKMEQLDQLYDHVHHYNPKFASYFMKPADIVDTFNTDGVHGVVSKLGSKFNKFISKTPFGSKDDALAAFNHLKSIPVMKFEGGKEGIRDEERWSRLATAGRTQEQEDILKGSF